MAKDLPYFKFIISEWNDGDITLCSLEAQGLFINLCSLYWSQECELSLSKAKRRYNFCADLVWDELINEGIIKLQGDKITINFLNEQLEERKLLSKQNAKNIKKRWNKDIDTTVLRPNNDGKDSVYGVVYNKEEKRREEKREEEDFYQTKEIAFDTLRDSEQYVEECVRILTGRGWAAADELDLVALLKNFLTGKCDVTKPKSEVKQHFKNWLFREKIDNLTTLATVFKNGLKRQSA
jgi:hypothetical protein